MKIFAVRIGDRYGPEYEQYLQDKLPEYDFHWIHEPIQKDILMQWNKMSVMNMDIDEPVVVMDIDVLLINDYKELFEFPVKKGEFVSIPGWWRDTLKEGYNLNGGFFKYYPKECKYIYDKFMKDHLKWQRHYIDNGVTKGPINGEQYFVEDSVKERLELKLTPKSWVTRWCSDEVVIGGRDMAKWQTATTMKYRKLTGNDYIYLGGEFHPDIKFVHFTNHANKPHDWEDYKYFK